MDCLKVTLKGNVNNELLPKVGELLFKVNFSNITSVYWNNSNAGTRRIVGDGNFLDSDDQIIGKEASYSTTVKASAGEYYVGLPEKYTLSSLNPVQNIDTSELRYVTSGIPNGCTLSSGCSGSLADLYGLVNIILTGSNTISGSLTDLDLVNIKAFSCHQLSSNNALDINIDTLAHSTQLTTLRVHKRYNAYGSISNLGECIKLTNIESQGGDSNDIVGDIETMAAGMVANGRTSGTLTLSSLGVKLNNKTIKGFGTYYAFKVLFSSSGVSVTTNSNVELATYTPSGGWVYA